MTVPVDITDPRIAKAYAHPLRIHILGMLDDRVASPSEIPEAEPEAVPGAALETPLDRALTSVATEQALSALGEDERRLLRLRYEEDLTQGQVAAALGVPEGTVKVRLHRVRARLRSSASDLAA